MNAEQKQRALSALDELGRSEPGEELTSALMMAQVLRELIAEQPASVPDEQLQAAFDRGLKAGNEQSVAQQIEIHKLHDSLAAPQPEQPTDLVRDAERYRWLKARAQKDTSYDRFGPDGCHWSIGFYGKSAQSLDAAIDAAMAAEKGGES